MPLDLSSPAALDAVAGGVKVYINQRHDGRIYWTTSDFSRFGVASLAVMRMRKRRDVLKLRRTLSKLRRRRDSRP